MPDYHQLIENIRSFTTASDQTMTPDLGDWAREYVQLCRDTNTRLRQCREYLRKGFRSEAIHLADRDPPVLDLVSALDFPELPQWREICLQYALPEAPAIALEAAQALSDAYADEVPLQSLLNQHRTLHLAQAPLPARIKVLRQLAEADAATPYWQDDVQTLERARIAEIGVTATTAARSGDREQLVVLLGELTDSGWRVEVPAQTRQFVETHLQKLRSADAQSLIRSIVPRLNEAHGAMDLPECQQLLAQVDAVRSKQKVAIAPELREQIEVVRSWVQEREAHKNEQTAFEDACTALQAGIDNDLKTPELERLYRAMVAFSADVPEQLEAQYRMRLKQRTDSSRRKTIILASAIAAAVVVAVASVGFWYYSASYHSALDEWVKMTGDATVALQNNGDVDHARSIEKNVRQLGTRYLPEPSLNKGLLALDQAITDEEKRAATFTDKMKAANAAPVSSPDTADLQAAQAIAKRPAEKDAVQDLSDRISTYQAAKVRDAETAFVAQAKAVRQDLEDQLTPLAMAHDKKAFMKTLSAIDARTTALEGTKDVGAGLRDSYCSTLRVLLGQRRDMLGKDEAQAMKIEEIIAASNVPESRLAKLKEYCDQFSDAPKTVDFQKVLGHADAERALVAWGTIDAGFSTPPADVKDATNRVSILEQYLKGYPASPLVAGVTAYRDLLKRGIDALGDDGPVLKSIKPLMSGELLTDLYVVTTTDTTSTGKVEKVYFTPERTELGQDSVGKWFTAYRTPNLQKTEKVRVEKATHVSLEDNPSPAKSPQTIAAEHIRAALDHSTFANWPRISLAAAGDILQSKNMNPVLKGILFQRLLSAHDDMLGWATGDAFKRTSDRLSDLSLADVAWMDPDSPPPASLTEQISTILQECPSLSEVQQKIDSKIAEATAVNKFAENHVGVFIGRPGQSPHIETLLKPENGMVAEVLPSDGQVTIAASGPVLEELGRFTAGRWVIDASHSQIVPEGSLVFIHAVR